MSLERKLNQPDKKAAVGGMYGEDVVRAGVPLSGQAVQAAVKPLQNPAKP